MDIFDPEIGREELEHAVSSYIFAVFTGALPVVRLSHGQETHIFHLSGGLVGVCRESCVREQTGRISRETGQTRKSPRGGPQTPKKKKKRGSVHKTQIGGYPTEDREM